MPRCPVLVLAFAMGLAACSEQTPPLSIAQGAPDAGCIRNQQPNTYDVFFVIDVSGSMGPFLTDLSESLVQLADGFPERDVEGRRVRVNYYTIAFVNDVKIYGGGRMTSVISVQDAFEQAIVRGATENNLNADIVNAEREENLLDALAKVIEFNPTGEAKLVMIATDAPFVEAPSKLNQDIIVQSTYSTIYADLERIDARVHAFTASAVDGITRPFMRQPELTTLPGSTVHSLQDLTGANDLIQDTLAFIAREASCN